MATKLSMLVDSDWIPARHERVFEIQPKRVVAFVSDDQIVTTLRLAATVAGPYLLLWVLHAPRGDARPGRYQSPPLTPDELHRVLRRYAPLFEQDGRGDLWIHARNPEATVMLDRHDQLFAYGPMDGFVDALLAMRFREGRASIPSPHAHQYHAEFDALESALARECEWTVSELQPGDE